MAQIDETPAQTARRRLAALHARSQAANLPADEAPVSFDESELPAVRRGTDTADEQSERPQPGGRRTRPRGDLAQRFDTRARWTAQHRRVVTVGCVLAFVMVAIWLNRPGPTVEEPSPVAAVKQEPTPGDGRVEEMSDVVIVDVVGKVKRPGIVTLPSGSRVDDAVKAAGGAKPKADLTGINRARVLIDGEQIVVDVPTEAAGVAGGPSGGPAQDQAPGGAASKISLNSASAAELETLPGVGPVTAAAIIEWRTTNGGFAAVDDLLDVTGIGEATLERLVDLVTL